MRKILSAVLSALIVSATVTSLPLSAGAANVDQGVVDSVGADAYLGDLEFEYINNTEARLTKYKGNSTIVTIPKTINGHKVVEIGDYAFNSHGYASVGRPFMGKLEQVIIPEGVKKIGEGAFYWCMKLESATIPSTVTEIGEYAFYSCSKLNNVTIPKGVKTIKAESFYYCNLENLTLHSNITKIETEAFGHCQFESITIPPKVKKIGVGAFSYSRLKTVTLNSELEEIGDSAFFYCSSLKSINIPDKVKSIGDEAFSECLNLETVTGGKALKRIGDGGFRYTKWDKSLNEKKGTATYLGTCFCKYAPKDSQLNGYNLKLKDGTTCICEFPIATNGSALKSLLIPASLKYIDSFAFGEDWGYESCPNLSDVYYMGTESQWYNITKGYCNDYLFSATIHYDYGHSVTTPKITSISNVNSGVKVSWNAVSGASKYKVFRRTADTDWTALKTVSTTYFIDKTAVSGETYYYTVRCVSPIDSSVYISGYNKTGVKKTYYAAPVLKKASNVNGGVKVTWDAVDGASKYKVLRRSADSTTWKALGYTTSTSYTDTTAESGKTYYYSVRCVNSDNVNISGYNETGLKKTYIAAPTLKTASNVNGGVKVTWEAVTGASKYKVLRRDAGSTSFKAIGYTTSTSYTDKTAVSGKTYYYTVKCVSPEDNSNISDCNNTGLKKTYVAAPVISKIVNTSKGVKLTWAASEGAAKYRVYRLLEDGTWKAIAETTDTSYTHTAAKSGVTYTYTVKCLNSSGNAISGYDTVGKKIKFIAAPVISSLTKTSNGITIKWDAPAGTTNHYKVLCKDENGKWYTTATTTKTTFIDYDVFAGNTYTYTIRVISADENTNLSGYTTGKSITI